MKRCKTCVRKKVKKAQTCKKNSMNTSVGVQNRVTIWGTIGSGRNTESLLSGWGLET